VQRDFSFVQSTSAALYDSAGSNLTTFEPVTSANLLAANSVLAVYVKYTIIDFISFSGFVDVELAAVQLTLPIIMAIAITDFRIVLMLMSCYFISCEPS
jgi:hypothetical protein